MRTPLPSVKALGISQDNIIFGMVVLAFVIYIAQKGELRTYMGFFSPGSATSSSGGTTQSGLDAGLGTPTTPSAIPGVPSVTNQPAQGIPNTLFGPNGFLGGGPAWFNNAIQGWFGGGSK